MTTSKPYLPEIGTTIDPMVPFVMWTDGGNRTHVAGCAYVIANMQTRIIVSETSSRFEGKWTNNDMEMRGILQGICKARELGISHLQVRSDSEWAVKILLGDYALKDQKFAPLVSQIHDCAEDMIECDIVHVRRALNPRADWLCRGATDQKRPPLAPRLQWGLTV